MKKSSYKISSTADLEARFAEINALEPEEPTKEDIDAIAKANAENPEETVSLEEYKLQREYSGRLLLRIPKELHKQLIESAKENGGETVFMDLQLT